MKRLLISFFFVLSFTLAQGSVGAAPSFEYRYLIDMPSAGILEKGAAAVALDLLPGGVVIGKLEVGAFSNFSFGISYGAGNLIGTGNPRWYKLPGINARIRLINESESTPAITLGFDSQGKGEYDESTERFEIKSPGFFCAVSKNFEMFGFLGLHAGINYSLEREDGDKDANLWVGVEKTIGASISAFAEYNFAINDNGIRSWGDGKGYLNLGVKWAVANGFTIGMDLRNMLHNRKLNSFYADRAFFIEYINKF